MPTDDGPGSPRDALAEIDRLLEENARLRREAETLAQVGKTLTESLDAAAVVRRIVDSVRALFAAEGSNVRLVEADGGLAALAFAGVSQRLDRFAAGVGLSGWAVRANQSVRTADFLAEPDIVYPAPLRARLAASPYRAGLAVPLRVKGQTIGVLTVVGVTGRRFDDREVRLLDAFADQAALALDNARLHAQTEQRRHEAEELARVARTLTETLEAPAVAARIVESVLPLFGAQTSVLRLLDEDGGLRAIASVGQGPSLPPGHVAPPGTGVIGRAVATGRPSFSRDITADPSLEFTEDLRASLAAWGTRAALAVPLRAGAVTIGVLSIGLTTARDFTAGEITLLEAFADQAALALDNARLYSSVKTNNLELETKVQERTQQLLQSEKLATMGSLLAGVAHELNNPLSVVVGQTLLLRRATDDPRLRDRAEKITRAAERCARIVRNFLALARQRPPERGRVVVNDVVHEAVELLAYPLRVDNVRVSLDLAEGLPVLWADANQLHQVLVNLMTNAHQALRGVAEPRLLTLGTRLDGARERLQLTVADNGPGIPPEIRSRVFDAFFTTKPPGQGTGLGLSLCQGIVASHHGIIDLQSPPGAGTVFTIDLPIESPPEAVASHAAAAGAPRSARRRILVIDDEPEILEILVEMLGANDVAVDTAGDGVRALEQLGKHAYDAVLTDVRMPGLDGPALYRAAVDRDPALARRFVFITGDTLRPETRAFLEATGAPVIHKPFDAAEVDRALSHTLSRGSA